MRKVEDPSFVVQHREGGVASCVQKMSMLKAIAERRLENEALFLGNRVNKK